MRRVTTMTNLVLLDHGSGGKLSQALIESVFFKHFGSQGMATDSALLSLPSGELAFTTDSFVVQPIFFPGGNIGKLAVVGTVNDLAVVGAIPQVISCGFILEEGLPIATLETIVKTMADEAQRGGVRIVTGDTKVVERGSCDQIFINTSGIGVLRPNSRAIASAEHIKPGDVILINGGIAEHGIAVMSQREHFAIETPIESDCAALNGLINEILGVSEKVRFMRDATRGGLATVLCEVASAKQMGLDIDEAAIPLEESVSGYCELLGLDPLYIANEGKLVVIVAAEDAQRVLETMRQHPLGKQAAMIGVVTGEHAGKVLLNTVVGGKRLVDMLAGIQLPRIC